MRIPAVVALAVIVAAGLPGCAAPDGVTTYAGYYRDGDAIRLGNLTVADGRYRIGYSLSVQVLSRDPSAAVLCGIVDSNAVIGFFEQSLIEVRATDGPVELQFDDFYEVPELTLGIHCSPTFDGDLSLRVSDVELMAMRTAEYW